MSAKRIVSLVPSQTELLYHLGLDNQVVGITKFCIHPAEWRETKTIVGGTKTLNLEIIRVLKPDLVIANKEENIKEDVEALMKDCNVYVSDVATVDDAFEMMRNIARLTGTDATGIVANIRNSFASLPFFNIRKTLYLIWKKPWMAAGAETFISEMMMLAGFENVVTSGRYPSLSDEDIRALDPEVVLLSSEPYPFKEQHIDELKKILPASKVMLADGEMFSWYGSRMMTMAEYYLCLRSAPAFF